MPDTFLRLHLSLWSVSKNPQSRLRKLSAI
ncbi:hypothetical protein [Klebsiella phage ZCKP8]|nr:hypothetical protein PRB87_gp61 [Klebsiella phage ZCKP8]QYW02918.1 hypothetical protein [Klebsiella phage ZCKP8]